MIQGRTLDKKRRSRVSRSGDLLKDGRRFFRLVNLECLIVVLVVGASCLLFSVSVSLTLIDDALVPFASHHQARSSKDPILDILKLAKVRVVGADYEALPSWEQVRQVIGDKPRILGLETCRVYRETVPLNQRQVAPAGMFSTGTNLLQHILKANCRVSGRPQDGFVGWQVNWGKHQSPRFRHINYVTPSIRNNSVVFPVVMVRNPWTWLQTMCRVRYSAHWFHAPAHCPNFIPTNVEKEWYHKPKKYVKRYFKNDPWLVDNIMDKANFTLESKVIPVRVRYKNENAYHTSLVHMWKDWNQEYFDAIDHDNITFPRLMIRLEDLVFFPRQVLQAVCECVGGQLRDELSLISETSKVGGENIHGSNKTGLRDAMISHIYMNRTMGMTSKDLNYAIISLRDSPVLQKMGYHGDPR